MLPEMPMPLSLHSSPPLLLPSLVFREPGFLPSSLSVTDSLRKRLGLPALCQSWSLEIRPWMHKQQPLEPSGLSFPFCEMGIILLVSSC